MNQPSRTKKRPTVLVIDDNQTVRKSLQALFEHKYEVIACASGPEGIAAMNRSVHTIVLDIRLHGRDGFWTYQAIRQRYTDVPIIFYSAYQDLKDPYEVINEYRPFAFLPKDGDLARVQRVVDEAVEIYAALLRQDQQRLATQRLASVGTLAAATAHEINTPLGFIIGNLELLESRLSKGDDRELLEAVQDSLAGAWRISEVVQSLRTYGRTGAGGKWRSDIREVLELATKMADVHVRHRARLVVEHGDLEPVACEPGILSQIFLNLLVNAAQAIPVGKAPENLIEVQTHHDPIGREVAVAISDTGPGIDPSIRDQIFDPFFTTKPSDEGTGLGLFITHNLVSSIGGSIRLMPPRPGRGATFEVRLPVAAQDAKRAPLGRHSTGTMSAVTSRRVLAVDDNPMLGRTLRRMLSAHDVEWVDSGRDALAKLDKGEYDVILCDLMMPECSGLDVHAYVAEHRPGLERRIVFLTGGMFDPDVEQSVRELDNEVLVKPVTRAQLLEAIETAAAINAEWQETVAPG